MFPGDNRFVWSHYRPVIINIQLTAGTQNALFHNCKFVGRLIKKQTDATGGICRS